MPCVLVPGKLFCKLKLIAIAKAGRDSSDLHSFHAQKSTFQRHQKKTSYRNTPLNAQSPLSSVQQKKKVYIQLRVCDSWQTKANRLKLLSDRPCVHLSTARATGRSQIPVLSSVNYLAHLKNVSPVEGQTHVLSPNV